MKLTREQMTLAVTIVIGPILLGLSLRKGWNIPEWRSNGETERPYVAPSQRPMESLMESFPNYWTGRDIFEAKETAPLPVPEIRRPLPRSHELAALPFRPYHRLPRIEKYTTLMEGRPAVSATELLSPETLQGLLAIAEPERPAVPDRRGEREHPYCVLHLLNGPPKVGYVIQELADAIDFKCIDPEKPEDTTRHIRGKIPLDLIQRTADGQLRILYNWTYEEQYKRKRASDAKTHFDLAKWLWDKGMIPETKEHLKQAITLRRNFMEAVYLLGEVYRAETDFESAVETYSAALASAEYERSELHYRIGECLRSIGILEGALDAYGRALQESPRHALSRVSAARVAFDLGRFEQAVEEATHLLTKYAGPDVSDHVRSQALAARGLALLGIGRREKALNDLTQALKLDPQRAEAANALGVLALWGGQPREAANRFLESLRMNQYELDAWCNLGTLYLMAGKFSESQALFESASRRDPSSVEAVLGLAIDRFMRMAGLRKVIDREQMALGELQSESERKTKGDEMKKIQDELATVEKEASREVARALQMAPRHSYALYLSAFMKVHTKDPAGAEKDLTSALLTEPQFLPARALLADLYLRAEKYLEAEALLTVIREADPSRADARLAFGCLMALTGRTDIAKEYLFEAKKLAGPDPWIHYALGWIDYQVSSSDAAQRLRSACENYFLEIGRLDPISFSDVPTRDLIGYCRTLADVIQEWTETSMRVDDRFERDDEKDVGGGWIVVKRYGIDVAVETQRCKFSGKQVNKEMGVTSLEREIPFENFLSYEATLMPVGMPRAECGLSLYFAQPAPNHRTGYHVVIDMMGKIRVTQAQEAELNGGTSTGWEEIKTAIPNPKEMRLKFERRRKTEGMDVLDVFLFHASTGNWIPLKKDVPLGRTTQTKSYKISVFGRGWKDQDYAFTVDNVRVLERKRK